jgi:16S rRNA C967 or C1407 C5-methylase (RsmB/RsmF family)
VLKDNIVKPIAWPGKNVWQIAADSPSLARNDGLEPLSKLLLREVDLGHVVRQELVSMIPALMLKIESHHNVLDVCAAPGSKTEQLLSLLRSSSKHQNKMCSGMVVANDADPVRINTLRRRYARCGTPNLMVTCSRAEDLQKAIGQPTFDRIVADVPCSGDGTIRKFPHIWRLFRPRMSLDLHVVQLQIASASVQLLKPGGRMVYSTCSINPLEDEAVVSALLKRYWGRLKLVDTRSEGLLPGLRSRPGQSHWECSESVFVSGEPDDQSRKASLARLPKLVETMYPPTAEEAAEMHLDYCLRILPQDNNTGGFFIAVLALDPAGIDHSGGGGGGSSSGGSGGSGGKKSQQHKELTAFESQEVMRNLGYNPKHAGVATGAAGGKKQGDSGTVEEDGAGADSAPLDERTVYSALSQTDFALLQQALQLDPTVVLPGLRGRETASAAAPTKGKSGAVTGRKGPAGSADASDDSAAMYAVRAELHKAAEKKAAATAKLAVTATGPARTEAELQQQLLAKKKNTYNGLFGSRAQGWSLQNSHAGQDGTFSPARVGFFDCIYHRHNLFFF